MIFVVKVMTFGLSNWGDNQPHHGTYRVKAVTHKQDKGIHIENKTHRWKYGNVS